MSDTTFTLEFKATEWNPLKTNCWHGLPWTSRMNAAAERLEGQRAHTRPAVTSLYVTGRRKLILLEGYFAQSNYNITKNQQHSPINRCHNMSALLIMDPTSRRKSAQISTQRISGSGRGWRQQDDGKYNIIKHKRGTRRFPFAFFPSYNQNLTPSTTL